MSLTLQNGSRWQVFQDVLSPDQENLDLANVNLMLELLVQKKKQLEAVSKGLREIINACISFSLVPTIFCILAVKAHIELGNIL